MKNSNFSIIAPAAISALVLGMVTLALLFSFNHQPAKATVSSFCYDQSAPATTTLSYFTTATGTTTPISVVPGSNCYSPDGFALDSAVLQIIVNASGTAPTIGLRVESSQDGVHWFPTSIDTTINASTTQSAPKDLRLTFSTTTDNFGSGTQSQVYRSIAIPIDGQRLRIRAYSPNATAAGANFGVWMQLVGKRQKGAP